MKSCPIKVGSKSNDGVLIRNKTETEWWGCWSRKETQRGPGEMPVLIETEIGAMGFQVREH